MPELLLRLNHAHPEQAEEIRRVFFDAYSTEAELIGAEDFPPLRRRARDIQESAAVFFGAVLEGEIAAVAELERDGERQANLAGFAVHPAVFRRGIGSRLLGHILETLDGASVTVSTAAQNMPAIAFYEKHGFYPSKRWETPCGIPMVTLSRPPCGTETGC